MRTLVRGLALLGALISPAVAEFIAPADGPVPFRRDRLPVDVDTMAALSRQLTLFTAARTPEEPEERRAMAQMTALALALDPANRQAREMISTLADGGTLKQPDPREVERARNRAWQTLAWLEMPEAGSDGQALAACLSDVLIVADPKHPKAAGRRDAGEMGAWKSWVADLSAFNARPTPPPTEMDDGAEDDPEATPDEKPAVTLLAKQVSVPMPLWFRDPETESTRLVMAPVSLDASISEDGGFLISIEGEEVSRRLSQPFRMVEAAMKSRHGTVPNGLRAGVSTGKVSYSLTRNGLALSGTTALLLDGAFTGGPPQATTLSVVGKDGKLALPAGFWKTLRAMSSLPQGTRIILPEEAADYLTALVVMDDAAFFMKHEVLLASTVDQMCDLASLKTDPEVADGFSRFAEIRKVGEGKALGSFVAHPATQQRLRELITVMPEHASARMLALQGSGSRPRFLQRMVLAHEIRAAIEPAAVLVNTTTNELKSAALDKAHESCRAGLDGLTSYIDIRDRDLHKSALEVADSLRTLNRLTPKGSEDPSSTMKYAAAHRAARNNYAKVMRELTVAAGDLADYPLPAQDSEKK